MAKKIVRFLFYLYHTVSQANSTCRFIPTCSQYAVEAVEKYGVLKGSWFTVKRLANCHPFTKRPYYDPV